MHISKSLQWLEPYIDDVLHILPELKLLKGIAARSPKSSIHEVQRTHAICHKFADGTFQITLMITRQKIKKLKPLSICVGNYSSLDILAYLAHELSHMRYWEHSPHRTILECKLNIIFMKRAIKEGYISEEVEFNIPLNKHLDKINS